MSQRANLRVVKRAPNTAPGTLPRLLATYASTLQARDNTAKLAERERWIMIATVTNIFAMALLVIVFVLEM
jgi:hypothetical protein